MLESEAGPEGQAWAKWRWNVSALAFLAAAGGAEKAAAQPWTNGDWTFDLQGQYGLVSGEKTNVGPNYAPDVGFGSGQYPLPTPKLASDIRGAVEFQPAGSPWSLSFDVQYGRTRRANEGFHKTYPTKFARSATIGVHHEEEHGWIDFDVGRDVGLGLFGHGVTTIGGGVRYAHFDTLDRGYAVSHSHFLSKYFTGRGTLTLRRKTDVAGPQIFIKQSSLLPGSLGQAGFWLDWGASGGVLFGRQQVDANASFTGVSSFSRTASAARRAARARPAAALSSHFAYANHWGGSATTPDVEAFAQLSWKSKGGVGVGVGWRVDDFFSVLNGALPGRHEINVLETGPYVDVSFRFR